MQGGHESREQELMDRECSPQRSPCLANCRHGEKKGIIYCYCPLNSMKSSNSMLLRESVGFLTSRAYTLFEFMFAAKYRSLAAHVEFITECRLMITSITRHNKHNITRLSPHHIHEKYYY